MNAPHTAEVSATTPAAPLSPTPPRTPQQKLADSRQALLDAMGYVPMVSNITGEPMLGRSAAHAKKPRPKMSAASLALLPEQIRDSVALKWLARWWRHHPARDVVDLGRPYLEDFARRHPGQLVAYAAGAGSLLWLTKAWRLAPTAAILSLLLKSGTRSLVKAAVLRGRDGPDGTAQR